MHLPCVAKYFQPSSEPRCPHCNDYWPHEIPGSCPCAARGLSPGLGEGLAGRTEGHLGTGSAQARALRVRVCVSRTHVLKWFLRDPGELPGMGGSGLDKSPTGSHPGMGGDPLSRLRRGGDQQGGARTEPSAGDT